MIISASDFDHFAFGGDAATAYTVAHGTAVNQAIVASSRGNIADLNAACAMNAFADHYLSDMFSTGHLRAPRQALHYNYALYTGDFLTKYMHDEDSALWLNVANQQGNWWKALGDKRYFDTDNVTNKYSINAALQVSIGEVWNAYSTGHTQPNAALTYAPDPATVAQQGNFPPLFQLTGGNVVQVRSPLMNPFTTAPEYTSATDSSRARDILGQLKDADYNPFTFLS